MSPFWSKPKVEERPAKPLSGFGGCKERIEIRLGVTEIYLTISGRAMPSYGSTALTADEAESLATALREHAASLRAVNGAIKGHVTEWRMTR